MDLEKLCAYFGGTVYPEDYRGDFNAVLEVIKGLVAQNEKNEPECQAHLTLLRCALKLQSGNFATADSHLQDLLDEVSAKQIAPSWIWRISAFSSHKASLQRYPPVIGFRHELGSVSAILWDETWKVLETHQNRCRFFNENGHLAFTKSDFLEHRLMTSTWGFYHALAVHAVVWHEQFPRGEHHAVTESYDPTPLSRWSQTFTSITSQADDMDITCIANQLHRYRVELELANPRGRSSIVLDHYDDQLSRRGDYPGLGWSKMKRADLAISPPFTNPIALNLAAIDSPDAGFLNGIWDDTEDRLTLRATSAVRQLYEQAQAFFIQSECPRGHAAVRLRLACVDYAEVMDSANLSAEHQQTLCRASEELTAAARLFGVDEANVHIVRAHQILVKLLQHDWGVARHMADRIGTWGAESQNLVTAHFLGFLLLRAGRRRWLRAGDFDFAVNCFQCAAILFHQLQDVVAELKALVAQCQVHDATVNDTALLELVDPVRTKLATTLNLLDVTTKRHQGSSMATRLLLAKQNLLVTLTPLLSRAYSRSGNLKAAETWHTEVNDFSIDESMRGAVQHALKSEYNRTMYLEHWGTPLKSDLVDQARQDMKMAHEVGSAVAMYRQQLQRFDIDNANTQLEIFISQITEKYSGSQYTVLASAYLYNVMGRNDQIPSLLKLLPSRNPTCDVRRFVEYENQVAVRVMAQDWQDGRVYIDSVLALNPSFLDPSLHQGDETWNRFLWAGLIAEHTGSPASAFGWLLVARSRLERRRRQMSDEDARINSLSTANAGEVYQALGRICLTAASNDVPVQVLASDDVHFSSPGTSWIDIAVGFIEDGRARALNDVLQGDMVAGPVTKKGQERHYRQRLRRHLKSIPESSRTRDETSELAGLELTLRNDDLLTDDDSSSTPKNGPKGMKELYPRIKPEEAVLSISIGMHGCVMMVITRKGIECTLKSSFRDVDVRLPVFQLMNRLSDTSATGLAKRDGQIEKLVRIVSDIVVEPVSEHIREKKHLTFIASAPLNAFPYGILQLEGKALVEQKSISSVPSLRVLRHLLHKRSAVQQPRIKIIVKPGDLTTATSSEESPLPFAGIEGIAIAHFFSTWPVDAATVTRQDFRRALRTTDFLHIGTHGYLHADAPLLSSISLRERFRVLEMIFSQTEVKVCVFAACLGGLGKTTSSGDVLGFSHAILSSGCRTFIGALWKISDVAATLLMFFFYRRLAKRRANTGVAWLLHRAQMELRNLTTESARRIFDELVAIWDQAENEGLQPEHLVRKGRKILEMNKRFSLQELDFSHPSHWSAFSIFGDGHSA